MATRNLSQLLLKFNTKCTTSRLAISSHVSYFIRPSSITNVKFCTLSSNYNTNGSSKQNLAEPDNLVNLINKRYRKKKGKNSIADESDNEEESDAEEENPLLVDDLLANENSGSQETFISVGSLRLDAFAKVAFNLARSKAEECFYKGELLINGLRPEKKSQDLYLGDEIDLIKQVNPENDAMIDVRRVRIVEMPDKSDEHGRVKIRIRKWQDLTVEKPSG